METIQRAAILGVTGFIGHGLPTLLAENGISTTGISRSGQRSVPGVDCWQNPDAMDFSGHQVVINLAGEPIAQRWNKKNRHLFHESRVGVTHRVVEAIAKLPAAERPKVLINASAVGIYGDRGDEVLADTACRGSGYLANLCRDWEFAAQQAEQLGVRVIRLRTGVVLGNNGPAFEKLLTVFKCGMGGRLGSGRQWMPWIHLADHRAAIVHAVCSQTLGGPVNACAPHPERNRNFSRKLAATLHRPAILPVPAWVLKLVLGKFGGALLASQRTIPAALEANGFSFRFPTLEAALADLVH